MKPCRVPIEHQTVPVVSPRLQALVFAIVLQLLSFAAGILIAKYIL